MLNVRSLSEELFNISHQETFKLYLDNGADINYVNKDGDTLLSISVRKQNFNRTKFLLKEGANPNIRMSDGETPLFETPSTKIAELLIKYGADVNADDFDGMTPVHMTSNFDIFKVLVENGGDLLKKSNSGTPIDVAIGMDETEKLTYIFENALIDEENMKEYAELIIETIITKPKTPERIELYDSVLKYTVYKNLIDSGSNKKSLFEAVKTTDKTAVELHINKQTNVNIKEQSTGCTPLHYVESLKIANILINAGANVNIKNKDGDTPLHTIEKTEIVEAIINAGGNADIQNNKGNTPLHVEVDGYNLEKIQFLLNASNVNLRNSKGETCLDIAICVHLNHKFWDDFGLTNIEELMKKKIDITPTIIYKSKGYPNDDKGLMKLFLKYGYTTKLHMCNTIGQVARLLEKKQYKDNINTPNKLFGETPIHCYFDNCEITKLFLDNGSDPNAKDVKGSTPIFNCSIDVMKLLINHGVDVNIQNLSGETPLHNARSCDELEILLESGANLNIMDNSGEYPLMIMLRCKWINMLKFIVEFIKNNEDRYIPIEDSDEPFIQALNEKKYDEALQIVNNLRNHRN